MGRRNQRTFARFTHADYIGELSGEPNPLAQTLGTYYFLIVDHKLQVTANNCLWGQLRWEDARLVRFVGGQTLNIAASEVATMLRALAAYSAKRRCLL